MKNLNNRIKIVILILMCLLVLIQPINADANIMPAIANDTSTPNNPPLLSITTDIQTVYVGELKTVVFTVNVESSCNPKPGEACSTSATFVPLSGANVQLQGVATGSGTTNDKGQLVLTINAANTGTITATASKSGYTDGKVTIDVKQLVTPTPTPNIYTPTPTPYITYTPNIPIITPTPTPYITYAPNIPIITPTPKPPVNYPNARLEITYGVDQGNNKDIIVTVNISNIGNATASYIDTTINNPSELGISSVSGGEQIGNKVTWTNGELKPGESRYIKYTINGQNANKDVDIPYEIRYAKISPSEKASFLGISATSIPSDPKELLSQDDWETIRCGILIAYKLIRALQGIPGFEIVIAIGAMMTIYILKRKEVK